MGKRKGSSFFRRLLSSWVSLITFALAGLILFKVGEFLHSSLLQGLGGVLGGAALSLAITIITSKDTVLQQNAKEANLTRKDAYYIPMFKELKQLHDRIEDARQKKLPYPQFINGVGKLNEIHSFVWGNYPMPTFTNWTTFKEQPHRSNFTEKVCKLFDEVQKAGAKYNIAVSETKDPVVKIIHSQLDKAFREWADTDDFKRWEKETQNGRVGSSAHFHQWNDYIDRYFHRPSGSDTDAQALVWAYNILGWVLADDIDKASDAMQKTYQNDFQTFVTPDISWFKDILDDVWVMLQELSSVKEVSKSVGELLTKTGHAKDYMQDRLNYIRDMYQGGEPPL